MYYRDLTLQQSDPDIFNWIQKEYHRQNDRIELIASENIVSKAVMEAQGSILTNKYAEGYPGARYYEGCEYVDKIEQLAIDRVCKLFECAYANVQPHSGAQANGAVFLALLQPGDTFLAMGLNAGGHLSHGAKPNMSGKWFNAIQYGVDQATGLIDYEGVEAMAIEHRPKLIIAGGSAYPRQIDFKRFRTIADKVGAYLMVDMAHFAGLVATGFHPSPIPYAHVVTSTTHKTLRGPRGGIILTNDADIAKKVNSAVFPGYQGGPLMHVIAAKAVAFHEALQPMFKEYIQDVCLNIKALAETLNDYGFPSITGGTDTHLICVDVSGKGINGNESAILLDRLGITCNKNAIPFDPLPPKIASGLRLGSPAVTSRGFKAAEFRHVGTLIGKSLIALSEGTQESIAKEIQDSVKELCDAFSIYA
ncbi:MAG: serine hydroxymethyltransferase [Alphaproteobacteria bacterium]|nr:serine hydroxymethyltransferase [Alphaproteobacteria bacterium]